MTAFLRTLRGQAALFALTTVLAVLLAVGLSLLPDWWEGWVVQKYPETTLTTQSVADAVARGERTLGDEEADAVYAAWVTAEPLPDLSQVDAETRERLRRLVERSMVSGTPEQRARAVALWETVAQDGLRDEARAYAERLGRDDVLRALDR